MTVVHEISDRIRVAEIHANANARIGEGMAVVIGNIDGVPQEILAHLATHVFKQEKVKLVDMWVLGLFYTKIILRLPGFEAPQRMNEGILRVSGDS